MKNRFCFLVSGAILALIAALPVSASGNNSGNGGGFGQTYCKLPSGEQVFVPWHYCKRLGGKGAPTDF